MFSMASSAKSIQHSIENLINIATQRLHLESELHMDNDADVRGSLKTLDKILLPVLHVLEEVPTRAIIVSVAVRMRHSNRVADLLLIRIHRHFGRPSSSYTSSMLTAMPPNSRSVLAVLSRSVTAALSASVSHFSPSSCESLA